MLVFCISCVWQLLNKRIYDDEPYLAADTTNDTIRYFNVRSKADMSLIYHTETTTKNCKTEKLKSKNSLC